MREVSVRMFEFQLDLARAAGVDDRALTEGLPSVAMADGTTPSWIDWDDFLEVGERLERSVGGPDGMGRAMRAALPVAYPELRAFTAVFVHPIPLFSFVMTRMMPTMYRHIFMSDIERLGDDRIRWTQSIPEPYRASETFHRATVSLVEVFPCHLELPEARVEELVMTARTAEFVARFPPPPSLAERGSRALHGLAEHLDTAFLTLAAKLRAEPEGSPRPDNAEADGWADRLSLSRRQRDVFALLVQGRPNRDIAAALDCSERNIEFHVGRILRAARVSSRAELLVKVLAAPAR